MVGHPLAKQEFQSADELLTAQPAMAQSAVSAHGLRKFSEPQTQTSKFTPVFDLSACNACGNCIKGCPQSVFSVVRINQNTMRYKIDAEKCNACGTCIDQCEEYALSLAVDNRPVSYQPRIDFVEFSMWQCRRCGTGYPENLQSGRTHICRTCGHRTRQFRVSAVSADNQSV